MPDVVIPVLNEVEALPWVLPHMPDGFRAIVVDNGSTDGSADVARAHGAIVVTEPTRGFGAACWAGLEAASPDDDVVCFMDGDGSLDPAELVTVAAPVAAGEYDLVLGARRPTARGAWPAHARLGNFVVARALSQRVGCAFRDLGPMRAARCAALRDLAIADRRCGWPLEMVLRAGRAGWRLGEVDVAYHPRAGRSKVTGTVRGTAQAIRDMSSVLRSVA
jgi:glycosyltransferase involved in cell wall biosynthesis